MSEISSLIEKYLSDQLSTEERQAFEGRCEQEPELARELELELASRYATEVAGDQQLKETLRADLSNILVEKQPATISLRQYWPMAAVILLLILAIPFLSRYFSEPAYEDLYVENFTRPASPAPLLRSDDGDATQLTRLDSLWQQAIQGYAQKDYQGVEQLLKLILSSSNDPREIDQAYFYLGANSLMQDQPEKAIDSFQKIENQSPFRDQALWYQALTYLKLEDESNCISSLQTILRFDQHYKKEEADKLLRLLQ